MWNIKQIEENPAILERALKKRNFGLNGEAEMLAELIARRKSLVQARDYFNRQRNEIARRVKGQDTGEEAKRVRDESARLKAEVIEVEQQLTNIVSRLPNRLHDSVPEGSSSEENVVTYSWGEPRTFDFPVLDHVELGERNNILELKRGAKVAGHGFPCFKGPGATLSRKLKDFMIDEHRKRGYTEVEPPFVCNRAAFFGTGQLPKFEQELYWTEEGTLALAPTAEVPLTNHHAGEILSEEFLTINYTAYTPCFRREAGSYGKDSRGIIRVHQFDKVELVKLAKPEESYEELERMVEDAENILRLLGIPYRRVVLCGGDIGFSAAKTYDIEAWFPSQNRYREISSVSNCEDFQARRAEMRLRRRAGRIEYLHTLNGSGLAVGRTWAALIENYQQADGSVRIPDLLVAYMDGIRELRPE